MPKSFSAFGTAVLLSGSLCMQPSFCAAQGGDTVVKEGPDAEVQEFRLADLEVRLRTMQAGAERDYFAGVLANRTGEVAQSILLLSSALPSVRVSHPGRAAVALQALADDYDKSFRYADAAQAFDDLLTHFSSQLTREQLQSTKDDAGLAQILRQAPPQAITWDGATRLKTERNPLNSVNAELTVNGVRGPWLLDTGANLSLVSKSFAERLGLKPLPGIGQTQAGLTGIENPLRVALLPTLQMGGARLHDVVVMVLDDTSLQVGSGKQTYQINGIIGYPVFQALGTVSFLRDGEFEAGDRTRWSGPGARMYMKLLTPVIECTVEGRNLPFSFDTGASETDLFVRYYNLFRTGSKSWKRGTSKSFGAGGLVKRKIYIQPQVNLGVGDKTVTLKKVPIYISGTGTDTDDLYGNLGQDAVANFDSFTLDFARMTFRLGEPLAADKAH
jgi:hypothetical protein